MSTEMRRLLTARLDLARQIQAAHDAGEFGRVVELREEAARVHRAICEASTEEGRAPEEDDDG